LFAEEELSEKVKAVGQAKETVRKEGRGR